MVVAATSATLREARRMHARVRFATGACAALWHAMAAWMVAGFVDMLMPLPALARGCITVGLLGYTAWQIWRAREQNQAERLRPEEIAVAIESRHPELDNALIHAVQFGEAIPENSDVMTSALVRMELERAEREATQLPVDRMIERAPLHRERKALLIVLGVLLATLLLFPRIYRFEVPRFALFWADNPPFTLTDFRVEPAGGRVRYGGSVTIQVTTNGAQPHTLELVTGRYGEPTQTAPLIVAETGRYIAQLTHLTQDMWYYVAADTGRSSRYTLTIDTAPRVRRLFATLRPPAYARSGETRVELSGQPEIQGLPGTQVALEVEADQPLAGGEVTLALADRPEQTLALTPKPDAAQRATANFSIDRAGTFRIDLTGGRHKERTKEAARGKIAILQDEAPQVSFVTPGQNLIATPDMTLPMTMEANDDVAVQRLELHRVFNRGKDQAQVIAVPPNSKEFAHTERLNLKQLGAKPGDVIEYYATAYDNDPQGIHNADSQRYWVWVVSPEDYRKALAQMRGPKQMMEQYRSLTEATRQVAKEQAQLAKEMEALAAKAKANPKDSELAAERKALQERQAELQQQAKQLAQEMRSVASQTPQFDVEKGLQQKLQQMAQAVDRARSAMQQAQAAQQLQKSARGAGRNIDQTLLQIEKLLPLHNELQRLQELAKAQAELAQQAQQIRDSLQKGAPDAFAQSKLRSLAEQQTRNQDERTQIEQNLREQAEVVQEVAPRAAQTARAIADALAQRNIGPTMSSAQQALAQQNAPAGAEKAEEARRALESLMTQCKSGQRQCQGSCDSLSFSQLGQGMGNTLGQMGQKMGWGRPGQPGMAGSGGSGGMGNVGAGYSAPSPGSRPGSDFAQQMSGQQVMAATMQSPSRAGSTLRRKSAGPKGERFNDLSDDNFEQLEPEKPRPLPGARDNTASRYPAEYRRLVRDYFKAVAGSGR
jgi:hypothetical protein